MKITPLLYCSLINGSFSHDLIMIWRSFCLIRVGVLVTDSSFHQLESFLFSAMILQMAESVIAHAKHCGCFSCDRYIFKSCESG